MTLPDHISGAIQRYKEGTILRNPLLWDIKQFYKDEYEAGLKANKIVEEETGVHFLEDEAAFIALHLSSTAAKNSSLTKYSLPFSILSIFIT